MFRIDGVLEFEYKGSVKKIPYHFWVLTGILKMDIKDKNGKTHMFHKLYGEWRGALNCEPDLPADFLTVLYFVFEVEYEKIYAANKDEFSPYFGWIDTSKYKR